MINFDPAASQSANDKGGNSFAALLDKAGNGGLSGGKSAKSNTNGASDGKRCDSGGGSERSGVRATMPTNSLGSNISATVQQAVSGLQGGGLAQSITELTQSATNIGGLLESIQGKISGGASMGGDSAPKSNSMEGNSIADIASGNDDFEILTAALGATGLDEAVAGEGDFTVLAPTDDAFRTLASETLGLDIEGKSDSEVATSLVETLGTETLGSVLKYHVIEGGASAAELKEKGTLDTLNGEQINVQGNTLVDKDPDVADPQFISGLTDIKASNGKIQAIDRVLLPVDL